MGTLFGFLPIYASSLGYNQLFVGAIVGVSAVAYVVVQPFSGTFADKYGSVVVTIVGSLVSFVAISLLPFFSGLPLIVVAGVSAASIGVVWTLTSSGAAEVAGQGRMGLVMGNLGSYKEVGDMAGPVIVGTLAKLASLQVGFVASGLLAGLVSVPLLLSRRKLKVRAGPGMI